MKIDTIPYLKHRNDIRVKLSDEKRKLFLDGILLKYGNLKEFCKIHEFNYDTTSRWLTLSNYRRREPSFAFLNKLSKLAEIKSNDAFGGPFAVGTGHSFQKIPRSINVDEGFWEGFGLYYGDGQNKVGTNEFVFTNINFDLSNFIIRWFKKYLKVDAYDFRTYVYFPHSTNETDAAECVSKRLDLPDGCVKAFYPQKNLKQTCLLTMVRNSALRYLFDEISKDAERLMVTDKKLVAAFLRGYLAAEGNVYMQKNNRVCNVTIGFGKQSEFEMIGKQLMCLGIEFTASHGANKERTKFYPKIDIHKRDSVIRLYETVGFGPNKKRHKRLEAAVKILKGE